ncbi:alpha/beta hydrolase [Spiractinospora alimapuensis]|uniref:alpha/beta fold hydrolase n=1 Tax=Spiractinospora alimapuensis TaxID=2820884 RepID=UPI001F389383|nr:alpha/beta hydrolase [Spiractinospora alimapuensis]QVQ52144.1 alpha/beta hydrolase [Spiractinospora alimapuensis]
MEERTTRQRDPFSRVTIDCPEGPLSVIAEGRTGPPVLLLSGAGQDNAMLSWRHLIPFLAQDHRVIALDWPKQGNSKPWNGTADHPVMLDVITRALDHFGLERVAIVGMSQGGALTLAYAIDHPDRVERIVAIAPGGIISFPPVVHQLLWMAARSRFLNTTVPSWMFRGRKQVARFLRGALFAGPVEDFEEIVDEVLDEMRTGTSTSDWQSTSIGFWRMKVDLRPRLGEITCPTLFIQGDKDVGVRPHHTIAAANRVPRARLEMLKGHGHWPNRQSPERVNTLIRDFLRD